MCPVDAIIIHHFDNDAVGSLYRRGTENLEVDAAPWLPFLTTTTTKKRASLRRKEHCKDKGQLHNDNNTTTSTYVTRQDVKTARRHHV
jgi:hypothetical protein